jgi:hypothetical protein
MQKQNGCQQAKKEVCGTKSPKSGGTKSPKGPSWEAKEEIRNARVRSADSLYNQAYVAPV